MIEFDQKISIFKDPVHTETLKRMGFVIVPFIEAEKVTELLQLYQQLYPEGVKGFFSTTFANNVAHREKVNASIRAVCQEQIEDLFTDYKIFFSSFIVKAPGPESELIMHQDMTLVNETKYTGINIWCPLVDLDKTNGTIRILPGSHRIYKTYRGASLPDIYDGIQEEIKPHMAAFHLKAGEAIIFDQSVIHYSPPNLSDKERPVINTFVSHQDAHIQICYRDKENNPDQVEIFEQEDDFLEKFENFGHNIFDKPSIGKSLGFFDYDFPQLTSEQFHAMYQSEVKPAHRASQSWWSRLFGGKQ